MTQTLELKQTKCEAAPTILDEAESRLANLKSYNIFAKGDLILLCTGEYDKHRLLVKASVPIELFELQREFCKEKNDANMFNLPQHATEFFLWLISKRYVEKVHYKEVSL